MPSYYVNKKAQQNGDHEVHVSTCTFMPNTDNRLYLGEFTGCSGAVTKAREHFRQVNGCRTCSQACHTQ